VHGLQRVAELFPNEFLHVNKLTVLKVHCEVATFTEKQSGTPLSPKLGLILNDLQDTAAGMLGYHSRLFLRKGVTWKYITF
jgi:hypothetical protein